MCSVGQINRGGRAETSQQVGEAGTLQDVRSYSRGLNVDLNLCWKQKIYTALVFLSECDEATNNKSLSRRVNRLEM